MKLKYPLNTIQVNETLPVSLQDAQKVRQAACNYGKRHGMVFMSRRNGDQVVIKRIA